MNSSFSFLRRRRFTRHGQHRGVSLIELTIGIAILVFIIGITLLTVTNRATNVKLENYATQMSGLIKQQRIMLSKGLRGTQIQPAEFQNQLRNLFAGVPDITATGGVPDISVSTTATECTGSAIGDAIANTQIQVKVETSLDAGDSVTMAAAAADALTREFDDTSLPSVGGVFSTGSTDQLVNASGVGAKADGANGDIFVCLFGTT